MRYLVTVSYDGSSYFGFQRQKEQLTIQTVIERSLKKMVKKDINIHSAGRTDRGVHAKGQTFHFNSKLPITPKGWMRSLNEILPLDIRILDVVIVDDKFHARHHAILRTYEYYIAKSESSVFSQRYEVYIKGFNYEIAKKCIEMFLGKKDFSGFAKIDNKKSTDTLRKIRNFELKETNQHYIFKIEANSFLRYMVRSIIGTIIDVATSKKDINVIKEIFDTNNRKLAGKTAKACGLYLTKVTY